MCTWKEIKECEIIFNIINHKKFKNMKKLEDFQAEKVELKSIYGGKVACPDTFTIKKCGNEPSTCENDGADCW